MITMSNDAVILDADDILTALSRLNVRFPKNRAGVVTIALKDARGRGQERDLEECTVVIRCVSDESSCPTEFPRLAG